MSRKTKVKLPRKLKKKFINLSSRYYYHTIRKFSQQVCNSLSSKYDIRKHSKFIIVSQFKKGATKRIRVINNKYIKKQ